MQFTSPLSATLVKMCGIISHCSTAVVVRSKSQNFDAKMSKSPREDGKQTNLEQQTPTQCHPEAQALYYIGEQQKYRQRRQNPPECVPGMVCCFSGWFSMPRPISTMIFTIGITATKAPILSLRFASSESSMMTPAVNKYFVTVKNIRCPDLPPLVAHNGS